jgi:hypothetical protein
MGSNRKSRSESKCDCQDKILQAISRIDDKLRLQNETREALLDLYNAVRETAKEQTGSYPVPARGTAMWRAECVLNGKIGIHIEIDNGDADERLARLREENPSGV